MELPKLRASLADCPVVKFGDYNYFVHPITDGIPLGRPEVLEEVLDAMVAVGDFECDKIITAESMGFPLAACLSLKTGVPYVFVRKRRYGLPGEVSLHQVTGYAGTDMFVNNVHAGDKAVFVDDVISTGGTTRAIVKALREIGAEIVDVIIVFEKTRNKAEIERELGLRIKTLMAIDIVEGRVVERR